MTIPSIVISSGILYSKSDEVKTNLITACSHSNTQSQKYDDIMIVLLAPICSEFDDILQYLPYNTT